MKAIVIPQDSKKMICEVEGPEYRDLITSNSNIDWPERVTTQALHDLGLVAVVDDDGQARTGTHHLNSRAMLLVQYPGLLYGDVVLFSETQDFDGVNFTSVPEGSFSKIIELVGT